MCSIQMIEIARPAQALDGGDELVAFMLGQPAGDLVEEKQLRAGGDRPRHLEALPLEEGQGAGKDIRLGGEPGQLGDLERSPISITLGHAATEGGADHDVLEHGHAGEGVRDLKRSRNAEPAARRGAQAGDIALLKPDASRNRDGSSRQSG